MSVYIIYVIYIYIVSGRQTKQMRFCRLHQCDKAKLTHMWLSYTVILILCVSAAPGQVGAEGERVGNQAPGLSATGGRAGGTSQWESSRYCSLKRWIEEWLERIKNKYTI